MTKIMACTYTTEKKNKKKLSFTCKTKNLQHCVRCPTANKKKYMCYNAFRVE